MISYIKGEFSDVTEDGIVVDKDGLGYEVRVPLSMMQRLPALGTQVKIFTYMYVREDALNLYGFLSKDDLNVFKLLITVNGIGPKGAQGILSNISPDDLRFAVLAGDVKAIAKAPGIGAKTAAKLILELKDKLKLEDAFEQKLSYAEDIGGNQDILSGIRNDAIQALVALGYNNTDAIKSVRQIEIKDGMEVEEVLKLSLKKISL